MAEYTEEHARAGVKTKLPELDTWPNQFPGYVITTRFPEYSSICPKTGLPDFGTSYDPLHAEEGLHRVEGAEDVFAGVPRVGNFYSENAVNKMLQDIVEAVRPEWCIVRGEFTPRGGLSTSVFARWPRLAGEAVTSAAAKPVAASAVAGKGKSAGKRNKR